MVALEIRGFEMKRMIVPDLVLMNFSMSEQSFEIWACEPLRRFSVMLFGHRVEFEWNGVECLFAGKIVRVFTVASSKGRLSQQKTVPQSLCPEVCLAGAWQLLPEVILRGPSVTLDPSLASCALKTQSVL